MNKYHVAAKADRTVQINGINHVFDSSLEAQRYCWLRKLVTNRIISQLSIQPKYRLIDGFTCQGIRYRPVDVTFDFAYRNRKGQLCVEDTKGMRMRDYVLRVKLILSRPHDFLFYEIKNALEEGGTGVTDGRIYEQE